MAQLFETTGTSETTRFGAFGRRRARDCLKAVGIIAVALIFALLALVMAALAAPHTLQGVKSGQTPPVIETGPLNATSASARW